MTIKVFIADDDTATLICPACGKTKTADVSKYIGRADSVKIKVRCACGHAFVVFLERRQQFRKATSLDGSYTYSGPHSAPHASHFGGKMTVVDISRTGVRIKFATMPRFTVGDRIQIEFQLDDSHGSVIKREVVIRNMKGYFVGAEYTTPLPFDNAIGFYLRP